MSSLSKLLVLSVTAVSFAAADSWGPAFSLGPTAPNFAIIESFTTFNPRKPPTNPQDALFLWPGISNGTSGLIQSGADQLQNQKACCGADANSWCVSASYFGVGGQKSGPLVPVNGNTPIDIHYKLASDRRTWDQTVTVNGKVISTLKSSDGPLYQGGWGTGTECQKNCRGTISTQTYKNTKIVLSAADPNLKNTLGVGAGVRHTGLKTSDGGKTWQVSQITIPPYTAP
ncbi:hypothetical protein L218DRAFT_1072827 [Marasmius fiardii PR-910]|nr:hypothetical protein L218DRAFT_1072827 [Marasmius fiardii PR-910]